MESAVQGGIPMIAPEMRGPDDLRRRGPFFTNRDPEMKMGRAYLLY